MQPCLRLYLAIDYAFALNMILFLRYFRACSRWVVRTSTTPAERVACLSIRLPIDWLLQHGVAGRCAEGEGKGGGCRLQKKAAVIDFVSSYHLK